MRTSNLAHGVFSECAAHYRHRAPYSKRVVDCLASYVRASRDGFRVAELAAGTGILTQALAGVGLRGYAVEPNEAMRAEAIALGSGGERFAWSAGSAEKTGLPTASVDWVCIANAFHLVDHGATFAEARRILRPAGYLTAIWLLDNPTFGSFQEQVEAIIKERAPTLPRLHPPIEDLMASLGKAPGFEECLYVDAEDTEWMAPERYLGIWRSSHLVPNAVDRATWQVIFSEIEARANRQESLLTLWHTRAWTVRKS